MKLETMRKAIRHLGDSWENWIEENIHNFYWSVNSLQSLQFLDEKTGQSKCQTPPPWWMQDVWSNFVKMQHEKTGTLLVSYIRVEIDWNAGMISWSENDRLRSMKIGKLLQKTGATPEQKKEFETRPLDGWKWKISTYTWDILTMSHDRAWTSCMRPGGQYEYGPFSDMKSGAALLFWYRPGAMQPCGREILRPAVEKGKPIIARGNFTYGSGGHLTDAELSEICGLPVKPVSLFDVTGIFDGVYDDIERAGVHQTEESIEEAENTLLEAFDFDFQASSRWDDWDENGQWSNLPTCIPRVKPAWPQEPTRPKNPNIERWRRETSRLHNMLRFPVRCPVTDRIEYYWVRPEGPTRTEIENRLAQLYDSKAMGSSF